MQTRSPSAKTAIAIAATLAISSFSSVWAQSADAPAAVADQAKTGTLNLEEVVVTGTSEGGSKMKKSVSISTLDIDQIQNNQPQNASDVLTSIPGVHAESSGGAGNANVTVRGLPISAGGARYVQFQEDGLPVLLFGDIAFGTPDTFMRVDGSLDHLEVVRGGSGSTLATNSPGGIINFITKTGEDEGGSIGATTGLGFHENRVDFDYGHKVSDSTRFFIGGYYDMGQGPRNDVATAIQGGQIKANITHEIDNGELRLSFKHLEDQQPLFMPTPVNIINGKISTIAGIDPRTYTGYSAYWGQDAALNSNNSTSNYNVNTGQTAISNALGLEAKLRLDGGWKLSENFRTSSNSGEWLGLFPGSGVAAATPGTTFATGPNAGQAYTGPAFTNIIFNTALHNLGNTANDIKLSKVFDLGGSKLTATGGLFMDMQNLDLTWNFNGYLMQATGNNPALLANSTTNAAGYQGPGFGGCCSRDINVSYRNTSPYALLNYEAGPLSLDGSLRLDNMAASGNFNGAVAGTTANTLQYVASKAQTVNYSQNHTEYSFGANYLLTKDTAIFARVSDGASFGADRLMFGTPLDGSAPIDIYTVQQFEGGVKNKTGNLSSFVTLFYAKTAESNYDATTQISSANTYDAKGIEIEEGYHWGHFHISGGATITDAKVTASNNPLMVGLAPNRQAKLTYQFGPGYSDSKLDVGVNFVGTTSSLDNQGGGAGTFATVLPAYMLINAHAAYKFDKRLSLSLGVYNLANTLAYTEADNGYAARALNGRTIRATLKYAF